MKKLKFLFISLMVFNLVACGDDEVEINCIPQKNPRDEDHLVF